MAGMCKISVHLSQDGCSQKPHTTSPGLSSEPTPRDRCSPEIYSIARNSLDLIIFEFTEDDDIHNTALACKMNKRLWFLYPQMKPPLKAILPGDSL
jgi:hypothetical protein